VSETKDKCTLSDEELLKKCDNWIDQLCATSGKAWCLSIPPRHNHDPDLLFVELMNRFTEMSAKVKQLQNIETYNRKAG